MRALFTIIVCKLLKFVGKLMGKGSSLPGQIALKLYPNILGKIKLPKYVIAVTGSNGKTSTVEMIAKALQAGGKSVVWNKEGSNQIEGVTTLILSNCTLTGKVKSDILLIESDERYAKYTFSYFAPTHYVITNLYRDQLTRNGHPQWVYDNVKESICDSTQLILNADDPLVSLFGEGKKDTIWFGVDRHSGSYDGVTGVYNDGFYCPKCGGRLEYEYAHYNHIGSFKCTDCGYKKEKTSYTVTDVDLKNGNITINNEAKISMSLHSMYNIYNLLAAYAVCRIAGVESNVIEDSLNNYVLKNGRVVQFTIGEHNGTLLTSKHENSVSYDQSIRIASTSEKPVDVMIIVDAVSRKYFTGEVSWLWDINFDELKADCVKNIILSGTYSNDLATRFSFTDIESDRIHIIPDINEAAEYLKTNGKNKLYIITCFSDKEKILSKVEIKEA